MGLLLAPLPTPDCRLAIWQIALDQPLSASIADWLSPSERTRAQAFLRPQDTHRFKVGRCALRQQLAAVGGCAPGELALSKGRHGKPEWPGSGWHFNLAHSQGLMLLALSRQGPVGIDVEQFTVPPADLSGLAQQVMTPLEHVGWSGVAEERRYAAFLRAWTRKEACLKAWGLGLHLEPSQLQVGFSVDSASQPVIVQPPGGVAGPVLLRYDLALADNADAQAAVALGLAA
ncbi:MAG: 4'-phosphopantetheinyl transferase superfamily protein [Rubrivivax sp.]|jgi:4'-phosphopantetheinyl transferase|nr:4'-phosphopantetheinyl transferase superfamily protein [Rubrivivax sp.]